MSRNDLAADPGTRSRATVVVTNYNYERHVTAAVDSALALPDVEVIVVDDGSTDGSLDVLARYADQITLVAQPNGGQGAAFNAGFAAANGSFVIFLDADDTLASDIVERLHQEFEDPTVGRVQFPLLMIGPDGERLAGSVPSAGVTLAEGDVRRGLTTFPSDLVWQPTSGNAFRSSVLAEILPMPTEPFRICADYYLSNLSAVHGRVAVLDRAGGEYRVHGQNGHYTDTWTMDAVRANIGRTTETHRLLIEHCARHGLSGLPSDPDDVRSVTALANRMLSLRIDPERHPVTADRRWHLARLGLQAALGRFDLRPVRRAVIAGWFAVVAVVPRRWVPAVARPLISVDPHA